MGIKHFYKGFKKHFPETIVDYHYDHDILILELNGIFYDCAKLHVYEKLLYEKDREIENLELFKMISESILKIIEEFIPKKTIFLTVDGFAPLMKYKEQLQRRYKNMLYSQYEGIFDFNVLTPGTKFMDYLTKFLDYYIRKTMNEKDIFRDKTIFFSNEKNRGEGEFKALKFLQNESNSFQKVLVYSNDTDWINLSLLHQNNCEITICRKQFQKFQFISISNYKESLLQRFCFDDNNKLLSFSDIYLMLLFLGNDHITELEHLDSLDLLCDYVFPLYKKRKRHFLNENFTIVFPVLFQFIKHIYQNLEWKDKNSSKNFTTNDYNNIFYYFHNMQNILNMNLTFDFDWNFFYLARKSPNCHSFLEMEYTNEEKTIAKLDNTHHLEECFFHLLILLPNQSKSLLPKCLTSFPRLEYPQTVIFDVEMNKFLFDMDLKYINSFQQYYSENKNLLSSDEKKRNIEGKLFKYKYNYKKNTFLKSYYGNIKRNRVEIFIIE